MVATLLYFRSSGVAFSRSFQLLDHFTVIDIFWAIWGGLCMIISLSICRTFALVGYGISECVDMRDDTQA